MRVTTNRLVRNIRDRPRRSILVAAVTAVALTAGTSFTSAAWTDDEWVRSTVGVSSPGDCTTNTMFTSKSWARQLSGTVLTTSLNSMAGVEGLTVVNNGSAATPTPLSAVRVPETEDAFISKLPVTVLGSSPITAGLGLGAPVGGVGTYTQWAQAQNSGQSHGASGLVSDQSGTVDVAGTATGAATAPKSARISLGHIVPDSLAGVTLDVGAVASSATFDGCVMVNGWPTLSSSLTAERDYGIAGLDLNAEVPAVKNVVPSVNETLSGLPVLLDNLESNLVGALESSVGGLLNTLGLASVGATAELTGLDVSHVRNVLSQPQTQGAVTLHISTGQLTVDFAKLSGDGLNGQGANAPVSLSTTMATQVRNDMRTIIDRVTTELRAALDAVTLTVAVDASVRVLIVGTLLGDISVDVVGTVGAFRQGPVPSLELGVGVLGLSTSALTQAVLSAVGSAVVAPLSSAVSGLESTLDPLIDPAVGEAGAILTTFSSLVAIHVNVQPDQPWPGTKPEDVSAAVGEFKVSAIRVGLVDGAGLLSLALGNSSAGPVALRGP